MLWTREFPKKKVLLVEDNAGWHRSKKVKDIEGLTVDFLPPYSPELQPAERLWSLVDLCFTHKSRNSFLEELIAPDIELDFSCFPSISSDR